MSDAVHPNEAMSLKRATAWAALAQYSGFALQFIASVIIARYFLDPAEVGIFSVAFSAAALVHGLQDFGLNRFIVGAKELSDDTVRVTFTVSIAVAAFIVTVILLLAQPMADFFGNEALYTIALVIGISYVFIPFSVVPLAMVQRRMDFRGYAFVETGANLVQVVITVGAAWYGYSSLSLAFGVFAYQMAKAGLTQLVNPIFRIFPPSLDGSRRIFTYGGSSSLISFTASVATRAPDLIVGKMISEAALGLYGRATGLAVQFRVLVSGPVESVFYPSLSRARDRGEDISAHYLRLTSALCAVTWAAMFGLAMGAEPLVLALYGERWAGVAPVMVWVALAQVFFIAIPMQIDVGYLLGKWRTIVMLTMLDAALSIGLLYYAAQFGLEWAAISRIVHGAIWWVIHAAFMQRLVGFSWRSLLDIYWRTFVAGLAAIGPLALGYAFWMAPDEMTFGVLALLSTLGVVTWYAALIAIRHPSAGEFSDILRHQREAFGRLRQRYT
ncbi:lipopolysaccharide biosynthesis protein [Paraurantiacibacter namhicola]|uniref:Lipopolysaccharide biosynthesis protein WzxC n=1 Tax=Paraurantiacibacter namhicola TaxID=645517 RepID=A0A1C7D6X0_9SPHN|nr:lipopolysaccharide biosynthesis protein [Paraurantiacibacter namhicola]ANU07197.1 Lipopolysaccharide biosynthesis protein WzxC [Paraurantiacibacter namhicola]